ncbi:putative GTP-binding protein EngB [Sterolibacterium denitrificans]|uniref:Probable GTP-binding protein EngB n=1 Tax=Sterolibacterium denitrificans TaxID=157592 RepID=A0A7Z7HQL1_9PROT|nr:putative GTP-binding protein EngB [Sterolibacterium denitrificans]
MPSSNLFRHAVFETSVAKPCGLPPALADAPEIAFVGRSNAGKSSALNTLAGHTRLAFVSKTPGRTQLINFFRLPNGVRLVDLPGYGYAAVPEAIRRSWAGLLEHYLKKRENLIGLVMIMDARRPLTELDLQMIDWFAPTANPIHILLSKADKLTRQESAKTLREVRAALEIYGGQISVQLFSSLKKTGIEEAETVVGAWLEDGFGNPDRQDPPADEGAMDAAAAAPVAFAGESSGGKRNGSRSKGKNREPLI